MNNKNVIYLKYDKFTSYEKVASNLYKNKIAIAIVEFKDSDGNINKKLFYNKFVNEVIRKNDLKSLLHNNNKWITTVDAYKFFAYTFYFMYDVKDGCYENTLSLIEKIFSSIENEKKITNYNVIGWSIDV